MRTAVLPIPQSNRMNTTVAVNTRKLQFKFRVVMKFKINIVVFWIDTLWSEVVRGPFVVKYMVS
jgi:hypothetical protein